MHISVIIPMRNAERTIVRMLRSVFAQSRQPDEIIAVDDGSADGSIDRIQVNEEWRDRVRILKSERKGAAAARNVGAAESKGDLLFFCDADIELQPEFLQKLEQTLVEHPEADFAYSAFEWQGNVFAQRAFDVDALKRHNYISTMSLIRRAAFPGFDETLLRFQDWDLWLTMVERGARGVGVPDVLFSVMEKGTMSRRGGLSRLRATAKIRKKHRLAWSLTDLWLALKESLRARRL